MRKKRSDNAVLESEIITSGTHLHYIGYMDKLGEREPKDGDIASKDDKTYLYKNGKWLEIIHDLPHIDYTIRY